MFFSVFTTVEREVKDLLCSGTFQRLHFWDKNGHAKFVGFRFYSAIWRSESRISSRCLEVISVSLIYSLTYSRKKELFSILTFPGFEPPEWPVRSEETLS